MARFFLLLCMVLAACGRRPPEPAKIEPAIVQKATTESEVVRFGPDEYGVACYVRMPTTLSCVKVTP